MPELLRVAELMNPRNAVSESVPPDPGDPCAVGQLDFTLECQSAHIITAGF